jgi:spore maturation protein CgeB
LKFLFYTHSLVSDWNHGNAHFLRGVMRELIAAGHDPLALEPEEGWSRANLKRQRPDAEAVFAAQFPELRSISYGAGFDHASALTDADVVIVHEWTDPDLMRRIGRLRRESEFLLLFHDTHHRAVSSEAEIEAMPLEDYDGVLAFGEALRERYLARGWGRQVFTWHEAADVALFRPHPEIAREDDLVWIGNWGDGERSEELDRFLIGPVERLGLRAHVCGVRYPDTALEQLQRAGIAYGGWLANADVPRVFARNRVTVHVPRRPYVEALPGIPTIRPFEALACGIPLVSAPWEDREGLFRPGTDFLFAADGAEMERQIGQVLADADLAGELARNGLETIRARHTCRHRVEELLSIVRELAPTRSIAEVAT